MDVLSWRTAPRSHCVCVEQALYARSAPRACGTCWALNEAASKLAAAACSCRCLHLVDKADLPSTRIDFSVLKSSSKLSLQLSSYSGCGIFYKHWFTLLVSFGYYTSTSGKSKYQDNGNKCHGRHCNPQHTFHQTNIQPISLPKQKRQINKNIYQFSSMLDKKKCFHAPGNRNKLQWTTLCTGKE
jgi:hypothetical protein